LAHHEIRDDVDAAIPGRHVFLINPGGADDVEPVLLIDDVDIVGADGLVLPGGGVDGRVWGPEAECESDCKRRDHRPLILHLTPPASKPTIR
jgi:hypothetical protein